MAPSRAAQRLGCVVALLALAAAAAEDESCDTAEDPYVYRLSKVSRQSGVTPFHELHNQEGMQRAQADDMDGATAHFRAAAFFSSYSPIDWLNLGLAYSKQAERSAQGAGWDAEALRLLREAVACFDLSHWLAPTSGALNNRKQMMQRLQANYAHTMDGELSACPADDCEQYQTMVRVFNAKPLDAALLRSFCTAKNLKARMSADERVRGFASAQSFRLSWLTFKVCGVVVVEGAIAPEVVDAVGRAVEAHFEGTKARIRSLKPEILEPSTPFSAKTSIQTVWADAAERSKLRFEVRRRAPDPQRAASHHPRPARSTDGPAPHSCPRARTRR